MSSVSSWYHLWRHQGFDSLQRQPRKDKGARKALSPEACQVLLEWRQKYPQLKIKVLVRQLLEQGTLEAGTFGLPSVYRSLAAHQLDARSLKHHPPDQSGPTKALECALANQLWMTDMMIGPTLKLASGKVILTRLFGLLDDCSRLDPQAHGPQRTKDGKFRVEFVECLAGCGTAPVMMCNDAFHEGVTEQRADGILGVCK